MASISQVWAFNLMQELQHLDDALNRYPLISIDTEFPGFIKETPRYADDERKYSDLKFNVDFTKIIQLGMTAFDENADIGGTWEFNFCFCKNRDVFVVDSVTFLEQCGIDFEKLEEDGIDAVLFSQELSYVLAKHSDELKWVTFHGIYDLAHMLKLLTNKPLPGTVIDFNMMLGNVFGAVVDVKHIAKFCEGLRRGELGLQKLASIIGVDRVGEAHQAGSDSLLTAMAFSTMKVMFQIEESEYLGYLYDIQFKIPCLRQSKIRFVSVQPQVVHNRSRPCVLAQTPILHYRVSCVPLHTVPFYLV